MQRRTFPGILNRRTASNGRLVHCSPLMNAPASTSRRAWIAGAVALGFALLGCPPAGLLDNQSAGWSSPDNSPFITGPYLLRPSPGVIAIAAKAELESPPVVEWWPVTNASSATHPPAQGVQRVTAEEDVSVWVALIRGLPMGQPIAYRMTSERGNSPVAVFKSGELRGKPFRFAAFGDTRTGHTVHQAVIDAVAREKVDFYIHTGDMVEVGGLEEQWDRFFQIERPLIDHAPIFPAIGNHDLSTRDFYGRFFLTHLWSDSVNYYYQDWGDLRIVAVDANIECRKGCTQNEYARRALEDGARKGMLLVMSLHHPPYSSGAHGSYMSIRHAIEEMAIENGVELVFAGHDHNYERTKPQNGVTYVVAASAGAPIRPVYPQPFTAVARTEPHFVLVDVEKDRMSLRAINLEGDTFDEVVLAENPPRSIVK